MLNTYEEWLAFWQGALLWTDNTLTDVAKRQAVEDQISPELLEVLRIKFAERHGINVPEQAESPALKLSGRSLLIVVMGRED